MMGAIPATDIRTVLAMTSAAVNIPMRVQSAMWIWTARIAITRVPFVGQGHAPVARAHTAG